MRLGLAAATASRMVGARMRASTGAGSLSAEPFSQRSAAGANRTANTANPATAHRELDVYSLTTEAYRCPRAAIVEPEKRSSRDPSRLGLGEQRALGEDQSGEDESDPAGQDDGWQGRLGREDAEEDGRRPQLQGDSQPVRPDRHRASGD
jgi:hypothetical protein